jgi:hypothetical protein
MDFRFITMIMAGLFMANSAAANDAGDEQYIPDGWEATGEVRACLNSRLIKDTDVLDNQTILFHLLHNKSYVNRLNNVCIGLEYDKAFSYTISTSSLCRIDIIQVVATTSIGGSCSLGDFVGIREVSDEEIDSAS